MDFAFLPPEVNSGRMYVGPGSGPMLAAAAAWDGLAAELHSAATSYGSVVSELSAGPWLGAASAAMTAAVAPFVAWMRSTALQAEQTATQAKAAAAAFEVTFAAMVPPPVIAANRTLLQALVATNLFGQNTPAIAFTESLYAEMWAQDASAMYGYSGASASATTLTPFTPAPQTTTGASPAAGAQAAASLATSAAVQGLTSPAAVTDPLNTLANLIDVVLFLPNVAQAGLTPLNTTSIFTDLSFDDDELRDEATQNKADDILRTLRDAGFRLPGGVVLDTILTQPAMALSPAELPSVTAGLGQAPTVGRLSVPQAWTVAAPEIRLAALTSPSAGLAAAPEVMAASSPGSLFSEMALANMAGRAIGGTPTPGRPQQRVVSAAGVRAASATSASSTGHKAAIAADVHEFAEALIKLGDLRDSGLLTDEEFSKEKDRLLAR
ncbi:PPE family protein [Mycobacterium cookii]|uniref:Putative PPE family protein PPE30 n=1 Tax=Mycobacterium cookii TaxID=1775 RepID=A0A7I7KY24_9MYCO|nr:PPE domain-containing protein [Mycobacterium cookii]MCV7332826.1 PPE domain-containing protein [Mycobacterium cookii]BBX46212.1 putative PPE family protein PPE30 [Mycobacterium cookii]